MSDTNSIVGVIPTTIAPTTYLQPGTGTVLTVGAGMEFATLSEALKSSVNGDTIAVQAGTYVNDFAVVTTAVSIVAIGGTVNEVATVPPPNGKALITVDNSLSIQGFTFTGGSDGSPDGNVSGIRLEAGNLNVSYCYFHDMQEGLLTGAIANSNVTIDHSEFARNGTGDGYTHNLYVGAVASLTVTNSYFHDANVGHEIKSRAQITTITNNVIADGPNGTASYDIDIPNAGAATITNNLIEKGPHASNWPTIHYGGEPQFNYVNNSLSISGNTIVNDFGTVANVLSNQSAYYGTAVNASITGNSFYGFDPAYVLIGPGTLSGNTNLTTRPTIAAPVTWAALPMVGIASGPELLNIATGNHVISGNASHLTVNDTQGSNVIRGGAGGLTVSAVAGWDQISTQTGATDTIVMSGRNSVLHSGGNDHVTMSGLYGEIDATAGATITGSAYCTYNLAGAHEVLTNSGGGVVNVAQTGNAKVINLAGDLRFAVAAGGRLVISDQGATPAGSAATAVTVMGAASGGIGGAGSVGLTTGDAGALVRTDTGHTYVAGGAGADTMVSGSGSAVFDLGGGNDHVVFGSGGTTVTGGLGVDTYHFRAGADGHDVITDFKQGTDLLKFEGFTGNAIAQGLVSGGDTTLTLTDGTTVIFSGVALTGYPVAGGTPPSPTPPGSTPPPSPTQPGASGGLVLTSRGQTITGGASALTVTDQAGGNTIAGGAGGLSLVAGWQDLITTAAGTTNQLTVARQDTVNGAGHDQVTVNDTSNSINEQGTATVAIHNGANTITGGAGLLTLTDSAGGNTVNGGAGGVSATLASYDRITTAAGASDTFALADRSVALSQGNDTISLSGQYNLLTATGAASIVSQSGYSTYDLEGADTLAISGAGIVTVGGGASATINSASTGELGVTKLAGGALSATAVLPDGTAGLQLSGAAAFVQFGAGNYARLAAYTAGGVSVTGGAGTASVTSQTSVGRAADTIQGGAGNLTVTSGDAGVVFNAGSGNATLNGGAGHDVFTGGSGAAVLNLGGGADTITLGSGSMTVGGGVADTFVVSGQAVGTLVIQNWSAQDRLVTADATHSGLAAQSDPAITGNTVINGSTWLTFASGAHVELVGIGHFG